ncbi:MAG: LysM peptidoglycan-binding domain-containing protein, partial [Caldimicrobium sp.]
MFLYILSFIALSYLLISPGFSQEIYHIVKRGETLAKIARKYGVKEEDLKRWNNLRTEKLKAGQKLVIKREPPKPKQIKERQSQEIYHIVKRGETLAKIARKYGVKEE